MKIWVHYAVGHLNQQQLAQLFECSEDTVSNAIKWAAVNRQKFNTQILAEATKEAIESRLRELRNDLVRIKQENPVNWFAVIGITRLLQNDEEVLRKLDLALYGEFSYVNQGTLSSDCHRAINAYEALEPIHKKALSLIIDSIEFNTKMEIEEQCERTIISVEKEHVTDCVERMDN